MLAMKEKENTSITKAAIVDGKLVITGNQEIDAATINRDTQHSLNALESILATQSVEERKELAELFSKRANNILHNLKDDGSPRKTLLKGMLGGITAKIGGDSFRAGALAGAVNEVITPMLKNLSPAEAQWISAAVGVIVNKSIGESLGTGANVAVFGTKHNLHFFSESNKKEADILTEKEKEGKRYEEDSRNIQSASTNSTNTDKAEDFYDAAKRVESVMPSASIALQLATKSDLYIIENYSTEVVVTGTRTYSLLPDGKMAKGIKNSVEMQKMTTAIKEDIVKKGLQNKDVSYEFTMGFPGVTDKLINLNLFLFTGKVAGKVTMNVSNDGEAKVKLFMADVYNFEKNDGVNDVAYINNRASASMRAGNLEQYMWSYRDEFTLTGAIHYEANAD